MDENEENEHVEKSGLKKSRLERNDYMSRI